MSGRKEHLFLEGLKADRDGRTLSVCVCASLCRCVCMCVHLCIESVCVYVWISV